MKSVASKMLQPYSNILAMVACQAVAEVSNPKHTNTKSNRTTPPPPQKEEDTEKLITAPLVEVQLFWSWWAWSLTFPNVAALRL